MNLVVREILVKELSKKIRMLTEHEDTAVMASYSLAQVHAAMADAGILTWKQKNIFTISGDPVSNWQLFFTQ